VLAVASIICNACGIGAVVGGKAAELLSREAGWLFLVGMIGLILGIATQIANYFQLGKRAANSQKLALESRLRETELIFILREEDPRSKISSLLEEVYKLLHSDGTNEVLPPQTPQQEKEGLRVAKNLVERYQPFWRLRDLEGKAESPKTIQQSPPHLAASSLPGAKAPVGSA
jgi:hypothetical protein